MENTSQEQRRQVIDKWGKELSEEEKAAVQEVMKEVIDRKIPLRDAIGITPETMSRVHDMAYQMYNNGRYQQALQLFRLLITLETVDVKYLMGIAASLHMLKDFSKAAEMYFYINAIYPNDPIPYYHAADCYLQMDLPDVAAAVLKRCILQCENKPEYDQLRKRVEVILEGLLQAHPEFKEIAA